MTPTATTEKIQAPTPDKIMPLITGGWVSAVLGSAAKFKFFNHLENGSEDAEGLAKKAGISARGAQAILDGLTGLGIVKFAEGRYQNTPESSFYLVEGKPSYIGGMAKVFMKGMAEWANLDQAVKTGQPAAKNTNDMEDNEFWHDLVPAIAALSIPVASIAGEKLKLSKAGAVKWLDVGGGSGVWSAIWLNTNKQAKGCQLDWPNVNKIAKGYVANFGVADRFETIDGDFHKVDFGTGYDYAIYGHIAHQEAPADNVAIFKRFRKALKPGGTLIVNDFILDENRAGHPFAMLFASQMLLSTKQGFTWKQSDYKAWLTEAGFKTIQFVPTPTPATMVFAS